MLVVMGSIPTFSININMKKFSIVETYLDNFETMEFCQEQPTKYYIPYTGVRTQ